MAPKARRTVDIHGPRVLEVQGCRPLAGEPGPHRHGGGPGPSKTLHEDVLLHKGSKSRKVFLPVLLQAT